MTDVTVPGHDLSPIFGFDGSRYALCDCGDRFAGRTIAEVEDLHRQHCDVVEDAATVAERREITQRGLDRAWTALADAVDRKRATT